MKIIKRKIRKQFLFEMPEGKTFKIFEDETSRRPWICEFESCNREKKFTLTGQNSVDGILCECVSCHKIMPISELRWWEETKPSRKEETKPSFSIKNIPPRITLRGLIRDNLFDSIIIAAAVIFLIVYFTFYMPAHEAKIKIKTQSEQTK